jgi:hypothetical protein
MKRRLALVSLATVTLITLAFYTTTGYYESSIDHDQHTVYFVKKRFTFRRSFVNPFANEGDVPPVSDLPKNVRAQLADYCKYAYGITRDDPQSLETCSARVVREVE